MESIQKILDFWFHGVNDDTVIKKADKPFCLWFAQKAFFDTQIREKFEKDLLKAKEGEFKHWEDSPRGRLALIILFDQFSRNMYRNTPAMYEFDSLALFLALRSIKENVDVQLPLIERIFMYMPLMHSENLTHQEISVKYFEQLSELVRQRNPLNIDYYESNVFYAKQHKEVIAKFGRFPTRNAILNRAPTPEEVEFLSKKKLK